MLDNKTELGIKTIDRIVDYLYGIKIRNRANEQAIDILDSKREELEKENSV